MKTADPLVRRVLGTIRRRTLWGARDRVVVALSGGPDSVALTRLLVDAQRRQGWRVVGVVHVNHQLRGDESDGDERFCHELAAKLGLPIRVTRVDVDAYRRAHKVSMEAAARDLRYRAFEDATRDLDATIVATGHTQDDQAETVLLRLLRGTGTRGVAAIRARRNFVARPLIDTSRRDLVDYLERHHYSFRVDSSNANTTVARNHLRQALMPVLAEHWPAATRALARFAELSADDEAFLTRTSMEVLPAVTLPGPVGVQLDVRGLVEMPPSLARRIVRHALESAGGRPSFRDVELVRRLASATNGNAHVDLTRASATRRGHVLEIRGGGAQDPEVGAFEYVLAVPGRVDISETGGTIQASLKREGLALGPGWGGPGVACVQFQALETPFTVRNRRPGDRFRPLGAPGTRKLQDVFVDRKIPREVRNRVPIVVDARGRIVWVAGLDIAHDYRVTAPETGVVILEMKDTQ